MSMLKRNGDVQNRAVTPNPTQLKSSINSTLGEPADSQLAPR